MGKRNKKLEVQLSNEELKPSVIGYLDETKSGPLGLIVLFTIFILFAIFLPNINDQINKLLGKDQPINNVPNTGNSDNQGSDIEEVKTYDLTDDLSFVYNNLKFSNFKINQSEKQININIENVGNETIDFGVDRYFIETYSEQSTLLNRHIFNDLKISSTNNMNQIINLTSEEVNSIAKIIIVKKTTDSYPIYDITPNDNNEYLLTCSNDNYLNKEDGSSNVIIYTFDKNQNIFKINNTISISNDNSNIYKSKLVEYQRRTANYNNIEGVSSSLIEISTGFTSITDIDLKTAKISEIKKSTDTNSISNFYESATEPKVIKFEMESRGYSCN